MSRRRQAEKREILPDPKFNDLVLSKFINVIMYDGKKSVAENIVYGALDILEKKGANLVEGDEDTGSDEGSATGSASGAAKHKGLRVFHKAIKRIMPQIEVRSRRVGGATYQVPVEVRMDRARALAFRWVIGAARNRGENTMIERLSGELIDAAQNRGNAIKKREDTHKMAEANKAFAHFRW